MEQTDEITALAIDDVKSFQSEPNWGWFSSWVNHTLDSNFKVFGNVNLLNKFYDKWSVCWKGKMWW